MIASSRILSTRYHVQAHCRRQMDVATCGLPSDAPRSMPRRAVRAAAARLDRDWGVTRGKDYGD
jgi:hypothetical protein